MSACLCGRRRRCRIHRGSASSVAWHASRHRFAVLEEPSVAVPPARPGASAALASAGSGSITASGAGGASSSGGGGGGGFLSKLTSSPSRKAPAAPTGAAGQPTGKDGAAAPPGDKAAGGEGDKGKGGKDDKKREKEEQKEREKREKEEKKEKEKREKEEKKAAKEREKEEKKQKEREKEFEKEERKRRELEAAAAAKAARAAEKAGVPAVPARPVPGGVMSVGVQVGTAWRRSLCPCSWISPYRVLHPDWGEGGPCRAVGRAQHVPRRSIAFVCLNQAQAVALHV